MAAVSRINPQFEDFDGWIAHVHRAGADIIRFLARDVRRERTGIHANIRITLNGVMLAGTVFNVERDEDRVRLANSAYKQLKGGAYDGLRESMPDTFFKHALDVFCTGLWAEKIKRSAPVMLAGNDNKPIKQLVKGLVVEGGGTALYAPPGFGKTNTLLTLAVCMDAGLVIPGVFELERPMRVLFINLERSEESLQYRLGHINRALGLPVERQLAFINQRGHNLVDVYDGARDWIDTENIEVAFLDSLSRAGGSLNEDDAANRTMDRLNGLAHTWVLAAHTPRSDHSHMFGSQMFDAAVDVAVQLVSQSKDSTLGIGLQVTKENDLGPQSIKQLAFEFGRGGISAIRPSRLNEFPEIEAMRRIGLEEELYQLFSERGQMTATRAAQVLLHRRQEVVLVLATSRRFEPLINLPGPEISFKAVKQQALAEG